MSKLIQFPKEILEIIFKFLDQKDRITFLVLNSIIYNNLIPEVYKTIEFPNNTIRWEKYGKYIKLLKLYTNDEIKEEWLLCSIIDILTYILDTCSIELLIHPKINLSFLRKLTKFKLTSIIINCRRFQINNSIYNKIKDSKILNKIKKFNYIMYYDLIKYNYNYLKLLPKNLEALRVSGCGLSKEFDVSDIIQFKSLKKLYLKATDYSHVNILSVSEFPYLKHLSLEYSKYAKNLQDITINGNLLPQLVFFKLSISTPSLHFKNKFNLLKCLDLQVELEKDLLFDYSLFPDLCYLELSLPSANISKINFLKLVNWKEKNSSKVVNKLKYIGLYNCYISKDIIKWISLCQNLMTLTYFHSYFDPLAVKFIETTPIILNSINYIIFYYSKPSIILELLLEKCSKLKEIQISDINDYYKNKYPNIQFKIVDLNESIMPEFYKW